MSQRDGEHVNMRVDGVGETPVGPRVENTLHEILWNLQVALGMGEGLPGDAEILEALQLARDHIDEIIHLLLYGVPLYYE